MDQYNKTIKPIPGYTTSSLVSPWDKEKVKEFYDPNIPPMKDSEFEEAFKTLYINDLPAFQSISRRHADPPVALQKYFLMSFVPCRGARPDTTGTYGFVKIRGVYETERECDEKAADLIKNVDSYHPIRIGYVGRPTPININPNFCKNVNEIDIHKQIDKEISANVKAKREMERDEISTIEKRAKNLQEESEFEATDISERYTTLRNKKAQLIWTYVEHGKKKEEIKGLILKAFEDIHNLDVQDPSLQHQYLEKFMNARASAGIKDENLENTFMKYLAEDKLDDIDFAIPTHLVSNH